MSDALTLSDGVLRNVRKCSRVSLTLCHGVPSHTAQMCHGMPSSVRDGAGKCALQCLEVPNSAKFDAVTEIAEQTHRGIGTYGRRGCWVERSLPFYSRGREPA